jgi:hypothetical protein
MGATLQLRRQTVYVPFAAGPANHMPKKAAITRNCSNYRQTTARLHGQFVF